LLTQSDAIHLWTTTATLEIGTLLSMGSNASAGTTKLLMRILHLKQILSTAVSPQHRTIAGIQTMYNAFAVTPWIPMIVGSAVTFGDALNTMVKLTDLR